jgi:release factor glutamine methyltransferase
MTVGEFLQQTTAVLQKCDIATARLDCLILLEDALGKDRSHLLAHPEIVLTSAQLDILNTFITRRKQHTPLAYIRGHAAFFGREFQVNTSVLVPRPETETMIELLAKTTLPDHPRIADIGTGSGCIGIIAALELPHAQLFLYDIDQQALAVAKQNADALRAKVTILHQDLLQDIIQPLDVLLANLPYVPRAYPINTAATFEPALALFSGDDGLDLYRKFWQQIAALPQQPTHIFTEALSQQHQALADLAAEAGHTLDESQGLIQHFVAAR